MYPNSPADSKQVLTHVVQKQIAIFGSQITAQQLSGIQGLVVDLQGNVSQFSGNPEEIANAMYHLWDELSPYLAKKIAWPLLAQLIPQK